LIVRGALPAFLRSDAPANPSQRTLTFAERVAYQRAIEDVYWRYRSWPKGRSDAKPALDTVMSQAQLERKVTDYLRKSQALEDYWQWLVIAEQLQAEMDRMAKHTKQPEVLRELFDALGNDPFVIAECLARPTLAEHLLTNWYAYDQRIHGDLRQRAQAELLANPSVEQMKQLSGTYSEIELVKGDGITRNRRAEHTVKLNREWDETVQRLAATFNHFGIRLVDGRGGSPSRPLALAEDYQTLPVGKLGPLQEDETRFYATAILSKAADHLKLATVSWPKEPLESWLARAANQMPQANATTNARYTLPAAPEGGCVDDTWAATAIEPGPRDYHTAVWTGNEMIVWGGEHDNVALNSGGRYNPATDVWTAITTTNAPTGRQFHTAVWTGTEMIV